MIGSKTTANTSDLFLNRPQAHADFLLVAAEF